MKCSKCGKRVRDDFEFCPNCGQKVIRELVCPSCGTSNSLDSLFCKKCGTKLTINEQPKEVVEIKENKKEDNKLGHTKTSQKVFSIISTSFALTSLALLFSFLFIPFLTDSFLPNDDYTVINFVKTAFETTARESRAFMILNGSIILSLFIIAGIVSLILFAVAIPKFSKGIKWNMYVNFSNFVVMSLSLFILVYVVFANFVLSEELYYSASINGWIIFLIVFSLCSLILNQFYKLKFVYENSVDQIITKLCLFTFVLGLVVSISLLIGGNKFGLSIKSNSQSYSRVTGDIGVVGALLKFATEMSDYTTSAVIQVCVFLGLSFIFEMGTLALCMNLFVSGFSKRKHSLTQDLTASSFIVVFIVLSIVFDAIVRSTIVSLNDMSLYGVTVTCSHLLSQSIMKIILSVFMLASYIVLTVLKKKGTIKL